VLDTQLSNEDHTLLERVHMGDDKALTSLYERYSNAVYLNAYRLLRDPVLAEEVVSATFTEVSRTPGRFMRREGCLSASLATTSGHRAVQMLLHKLASDRHCTVATLTGCKI
jgi:DNA-directed RNA polymerase specialized sigma24 family protein